jgi:hypothetical protein
MATKKTDVDGVGQRQIPSFLISSRRPEAKLRGAERGTDQAKEKINMERSISVEGACAKYFTCIISFNYPTIMS